MRFMLKVTMPNERSNEAISDASFGPRIQKVLKEIKAENAFFTTVNGQRGAYVVCNMNDVSQMPAIAEPFFLWLNAGVEFIPVMTPDDLAKAGPSIESAVKNWKQEQEVYV